MSIVTKKGDAGTTGLMFNRRVSKTHPRVAACGALDELNAALGLARATANSAFISTTVLPIQKTLVGLMGEVGTLLEDRERYEQGGYSRIQEKDVSSLEATVRLLESQSLNFQGWATPGGNVRAAMLDMARTVCRRAERAVCVLNEADELKNPQILVFLNRLSDLLWLMARHAEDPNPRTETASQKSD